MKKTILIAEPGKQEVITTRVFDAPLEQENGKIKVTDKSVFEMVGDRAGMLKSGMETGAPETMDRPVLLVEG